jgi:sugar phosphate isomerase/epimerase
MRLGGHCFRHETVEELRAALPKLDGYGLSAITAPGRLVEMTYDEAAAFGEEARALGLVVGEAGWWGNLMREDPEARADRIELVRRMLRKADAMGCRCVVTLVGTRDPSNHGLAPHPYMFTDAAKKEFREIVLRILDGLDLRTTRYVIEPWCNTFFYQPEDIRAFIDSVGHPSFGLHLDQMNMVSHRDFYRTTELINRTFDLLADRVASVHLKDIRWDYKHMFVKWDEVLIGDGVLDYDTYLRRLAELPPDTPCFCEHLKHEAEFTENFNRLHERAGRLGLRFLRRQDHATAAGATGSMAK